MCFLFYSIVSVKEVTWKNTLLIILKIETVQQDKPAYILHKMFELENEVYLRA